MLLRPRGPRGNLDHDDGPAGRYLGRPRADPHGLRPSAAADRGTRSVRANSANAPIAPVASKGFSSSPTTPQLGASPVVRLLNARLWNGQGMCQPAACEQSPRKTFDVFSLTLRKGRWIGENCKWLTSAL